MTSMKNDINILLNNKLTNENLMNKKLADKNPANKSLACKNVKKYLSLCLALVLSLGAISLMTGCANRRIELPTDVSGNQAAGQSQGAAGGNIGNGSTSVDGDVAGNTNSNGAGNGTGMTGGDAAGKFKIVCTIYPEYDWMKQLLGNRIDDCELTLLMDNGVDLHSYQPTADDLIKISSCDMFVYVGGESDVWVEDALKEAVNKDMVVINLMDVLGDHVKAEEVKEGMQAEDDHEADEEIEYDEHVWLSIRNAETITDYITDKLVAMDPEHADTYKANDDAYQKQLSELDGEYEAVFKDSKYHTLVFGDRFPFRYMTDDYDVDYYAAFVGCSAETEASFKTVAFLASKLNELQLPAILTIEGTQHRIAETIVANTKSQNQQILVLDSMQATTSADSAAGITYISIMQDNLETLKQALN